MPSADLKNPKRKQKERYRRPRSKTRYGTVWRSRKTREEERGRVGDKLLEFLPQLAKADRYD